jgi:penicillin-insensitive murein DD-endopeptidase
MVFPVSNILGCKPFKGFCKVKQAMKKKRTNKLIKKIILTALLLGMIFPVSVQTFYKNEGQSKSIGTVSNGKLVNGYKMPYSGANFRFFSAFDYYILGRCYVHSSVYDILIESYEELEEIYPDYTFRIMECSKKKGGRPFPHRTHQNGTSVDFMTPLKKEGEVIKRYDRIGMWRYLMDFDENGKWELNDKVAIDFDKTAKHILILNKVARKHGYKIKKVILETNLKDEIFSSKYGKELKRSGIYFVRHLPEKINKLHDDHYHIDFEEN